MKRLPAIIACVLVGSVLFLAGYWITDFYEYRRVWKEDRLISRQAVPTNVRRETEGITPAASPIFFQDVALRFGLDFTYFDGAGGNLWLMETTGGGVAVLDYDGDGWQDLFLVNGSRLPVDAADRTHLSAMFRNLAEQGFEDTSRQAGLELVSYGQGATAADFDNDGFDDLSLTSYGRHFLFHNNGDGTFLEVTDSAGANTTLWSTSAAFADLDRDGQLDIYVCTYADVPIDKPQVCLSLGARVHCGPLQYRAQPDLLFHNQGDGSFIESSRAAGICDQNGRGLALAIADLNGDDLPDIFVANDTSENLLFINQVGLRFLESGLSLGVSLTGSGSTMQGMGVACADFDHNGWPDLFVTDFYGEKNILFQNIGNGLFVDVTDLAGLGPPSRDRLAFGTVPIDADLDGLPDIFVANGHVDDLSSQGIPYKMRQQLFHNNGNGKFGDISDSVGPYFRERLLGRGVAAADLNNDGLPDVVVSHIQDRAALLLNQTSTHGHWLGLEFVGTRSNRSGLNVKVELTVAGQQRYFETVAGGGYLSSSDKRLLVGVGEARSVDRVTIRWPSGSKTTLSSLPADRYHRLIEPIDSRHESHAVLDYFRLRNSIRSRN